MTNKEIEKSQVQNDVRRKQRKMKSSALRFSRTRSKSSVGSFGISNVLANAHFQFFAPSLRV